MPVAFILFLMFYSSGTEEKIEGYKERWIERSEDF